MSESWRPLSEVARLRMGETIIASDCDGLGLPVYSANTSDSPWNYSSKARLSFGTGTIVVGARGSIGYPRMPEGPFASTQTTIVVEPNKSEIEPRYLLWILRRFDFGSMALQQAVPMLTVSDFGRASIRMLPVIEQKEIAQILDTLDTQIRQTEALIAKLEQIKQGLLTDLLTRGIDQNGQLRPTPDQAPHLYKDSPLGRIPREWDVRKLKEKADVIDPQPDHRTPPEAEGGVPYIGIGDFDWAGKIDTSACRKVIRDAFNKQQARFSINQGDVIFGKIGTLGRPKILPNGMFSLSANVLLIKPIDEGNFIYHLLNCEGLKRQVDEITNTTSQPALGIQTMKELLILQPDETEKSRISAILDAHDATIKSEAKTLNQLLRFKAGLMDDLLTGRVRVTPLLKKAEEAVI